MHCPALIQAFAFGQMPAGCATCPKTRSTTVLPRQHRTAPPCITVFICMLGTRPRDIWPWCDRHTWGAGSSTPRHMRTLQAPMDSHVLQAPLPPSRRARPRLHVCHASASHPQPEHLQPPAWLRTGALACSAQRPGFPARLPAPNQAQERARLKDENNEVWQALLCQGP